MNKSSRTILTSSPNSCRWEVPSQAQTLIKSWINKVNEPLMSACCCCPQRWQNLGETYTCLACNTQPWMLKICLLICENLQDQHISSSWNDFSVLSLLSDVGYDIHTNMSRSFPHIQLKSAAQPLSDCDLHVQPELLSLQRGPSWVDETSM